MNTEEINVLLVEDENPSMETMIRDMQGQIASLVIQLHPAELELQHREHGYLFSHVRPYSAKEKLGTNWKYQLKDIMPSMDLFLNSEKDGLKPVDIMLAGIYSNESHSIQKGKKITIHVTAGDTSYNGTHTALFVDAHNIIIPIAKNGDACGKYQNTEKVQNAQKRIDSLNKSISRLQEQIDALLIPPVEKTSLEEEPLHAEEKQQHAPDKPEPKTHTSTMKIVAGVALAIGVGATIIYFATNHAEKAAA
jgi:hypothetical protein